MRRALVVLAALVLAAPAAAHPSRKDARDQAKPIFAALANGRPWRITSVGDHRQTPSGRHYRYVYGRIAGCRQRITLASWGLIDADPPEGPMKSC
jgi:hypothetical protein